MGRRMRRPATLRQRDADTVVVLPGSGRHRGQSKHPIFPLLQLGVGVLGLLATFISSAAGDGSRMPSRPTMPSVFASYTPTVKDQLALLREARAALHGNSAAHQWNALRFLQQIATDQTSPQFIRVEALQGVGEFVKSDTGPRSTDSATQCVQDKRTLPELSENGRLALNIVGHRLLSDTGVHLDLSSINLINAHLENLDLRNVDFSGSLLCRAFFTSSRLEGASFAHANLEYSDLTYSSAGVDQLLVAATVRGARVPTKLKKVLAERLATDPVL
jgi:hypothetical protein